MASKKVLWTTDIHLNFLTPTDLEFFIANINSQSPDILLIGGDIGEAQSVCLYLRQLEQSIDCQIYFVLGNHDYYRGSISAINNDARRLSKSSKKLLFLDTVPFIKLTKEVALVGCGAWADGRFGDYNRSDVMLNDYILINEFVGLNKCQRLQKLNELGDEAAKKIENGLLMAFKKHKKVLCLTHVPPFRESCWHEGKISDENYLPHFSCKSVGDAIKKVMQSQPNRYLEVLCGHTHSSGFAQILDNLSVNTGQASYGKPEIQKTNNQLFLNL